MSNRYRKKLAQQIARARQGGASLNPLKEIFDEMMEDELKATVTPPRGPKKLVEYTVQFKPMGDPWLGALPAEVAARLNEIGEDVVYRDKPWTAELEAMLAAYPDVPKIYNFLQISFGIEGLDADAERICELCYARFPDYLFGATSYANLCLHRGRIEEAEKIFEGRRLIHEFLKGRMEMHVTEFVCFYVTLGMIQVEREKFGDAQCYLDIVKELAPDGRNVKALEARIRQGLAPRVAERLTERFQAMHRQVLAT